MGVVAIKEADIEVASKMDDIDSAALSLQTIAGITDGGIASMYLDEDSWSDMEPEARAKMLRSWLDAEKLYET